MSPTAKRPRLRHRIPKMIRSGREREQRTLAAQQVAAPAPAAMLLDIKGIGPEFAAILWSEGLSAGTRLFLLCRLISGLL